MGYFDLDAGLENTLTTNLGNNIVYHDIFVFVDRLKDLARIRPIELSSVLLFCLRGEALLWYIIELIMEEESDLRNAKDAQLWYEILINCFQMEPSVAMIYYLAHFIHRTTFVMDRILDAGYTTCSNCKRLLASKIIAVINYQSSGNSWKLTRAAISLFWMRVRQWAVS